MTHTVDPLNVLRPLREEEIEGRTSVRPQGASAAPLAYDVYRNGNELVIEFDAPGVSPSDIGVGVEDRSVVVSLRRVQIRGAGIDMIEAGRQHGTFHQRLWLGDRWDLDRLRARAENGVLSLRAPLVAHSMRRDIEVAFASGPDKAAVVASAGDWAEAGESAELGRGDVVHTAA